VIRLEPCLDGAVLRIILARPKANIIDAAMIEAIQGGLATGVTAATRLIVFEGEGKHFSFGASVEEHTAEAAPGMLAAFHGLFAALAECAVPTVAVLRGLCLGGGLELASWCTWIVATRDARMGQPEIDLAVFPPMASVLLPWRLGGAAALDLCVSGRQVGAEEAHRLGLVHTVTDDPEAWWTALVKDRLGRTSASSLRFAERAVRMGLMRRLWEDLPALEQLYIEELMKTADANEGIAAFLERRTPTYRNH
jgi:cyclohexa-1,5-dienecarbonyl-CoA hydratase